MVSQKNNKKITAIIPAYNEAERIERVLDVVTTYPHFEKIIVVDDGSTDNTENIVKRYQVQYIKNATNKGKGYAMDRGVSLADSDILFFCDADISGLTHAIIEEIVGPVLRGDVDMFIGMRNRKMYIAHYILALIPLLGGERAMKKTLWRTLPDSYKQYFKIETALNFYALHYGNGFQYKIFTGLSQVIKEKKYGLWKGLKQRYIMMQNIISAQFTLHRIHFAELVKNKRPLAFISLQNFMQIVRPSTDAVYGRRRRE